MRLTPHQLNRSTLQRQLLLRREQLSVVEAFGRVLALQAQEPPSPYLALWNRIERFDPAELEAAFTNQDVVKATLMRITQHAVLAVEYPLLHEAMQGTLCGSRLNDRRFRSTGLSIEQADALVPHVLDFLSEPRRNADVDQMVADHLGRDPDQYIWWALRTFGPIWRVPNGDRWSFGAYPEFIAANKEDAPSPSAGIGYLFRRYLEAFGPASRQDFGQFALLRQSEVKPEVDLLADELVRLEGPGGQVLYDVAGASIPEGDVTAPPRLLPMWDSVLFAYKDRTRIIPEEYRKSVIRSNGDSLPTLLVDGYVVGVWRPVEEGIEATAFHPLPDGAWDGLELEAERLVAFLADRPPTIYSRYSRWWSELPDGECRIIGTSSPG